MLEEITRIPAPMWDTSCVKINIRKYFKANGDISNIYWIETLLTTQFFFFNYVMFIKIWMSLG